MSHRAMTEVVNSRLKIRFAHSVKYFSTVAEADLNTLYIHPVHGHRQSRFLWDSGNFKERSDYIPSSWKAIELFGQSIGLES